jgi:hypothetical protein
VKTVIHRHLKRKNMKPEQVLYEFTRVGCVVDLMFSFVTLLVAKEVEQPVIDSIFAGLKESASKSNEVHQKAVLEAIENFEKVVLQYKEAIKK